MKLLRILSPDRNPASRFIKVPSPIVSDVFEGTPRAGSFETKEKVFFRTGNLCVMWLAPTFTAPFPVLFSI
jgi:hypothetical protein